MTRINCVTPTELCDQHLVAEYRELPRIFPLALAAAKRQLSGARALQLPDRYVMGPGHVKFFYTRLLWVSNRHIMLVGEMARRGFATNIINPEKRFGAETSLALVFWWKWWEPDAAAVRVNRLRLAERTPATARWTNRVGG